MQLQFLGTGAGVPIKNRNVMSLALKLLQERNAVWLFDVGEGTQMQILYTSIRPRKIEKIFITHLHGDHLFGLPGLLSSRSFQGGEKNLSSLTIYGPVGIKKFIKTSLYLSMTRINYEIKFYEIPKIGGKIFADDQFEIYALPLEHGILSFGYRVVEKSQEGRLQVERLHKLSIPSGPLFGQLKRGEKVKLADGRILDGKDFVSERKKGRIIAIMGDTRKSKQAVLLADDADVLVHEATFECGEEKKAHRYFHSTTTQAAEVAKEAKVQKLILTHYSARYNNQDLKLLRKQAQKVFTKVVTLKDLDEIEIPFRKIK
ncbi:MAG: ribonuclease Z [Streptococcaceae bacterium]|jgi:ribonuclease Z|nr:ribonuclease Z [Streptococcaceae bacterium]